MHYELIEKAIEYILKNANRQPQLNEIAAKIGLSTFHFQRIFLEWVGVTPKEFLKLITLQRAKELLRESQSLLETSLDLGLSGTSRLHDHFVTIERMTPGEYKKLGEGIKIFWCTENTLFGLTLFAATERGLCRISFVDDEKIAQQQLMTAWPKATFINDKNYFTAIVPEIIRRMHGASPKQSIGLLLNGSDFRINVWQALLNVPYGAVVSYQKLAQMAETPTAVRAVASCVAANPLAILIPCHRVIQSSGIYGNYRWGQPRKIALIGYEHVLKNKS